MTTRSCLAVRCSTGWSCDGATGTGDGGADRTPRTIAAEAAEHLAAGNPDEQVLGALLDADDASTGAALDTLSDAVRTRRICLATRAGWPLARRL